ncbi:MAG TPA: ABC transporter ATP-binding protein [Alphaproteobacteria bacterium]|nr:ABC transporter ATP-binding protein [Alphaproteobacteria bacterium]
MSGPAFSSLLSVENLTVGFKTESSGDVLVVEGVSFSVAAGEMVGLVGESGCGKSVTAMSILKLLPMPPAFIAGGRVLFEGNDMVGFEEEAMRRVRGDRIAMIFQEPMTSLNPTFTIGYQLDEVLTEHRPVSSRVARTHSIELLRKVGVGAAETRCSQYPHQLSGGLRQRVMIAMALACEPRLLIADEPTTALDVTIQAQILDLLKRLQAEFGMAVLLITHDLGVVAECCSRVMVMYAGRVVETGPARRLFRTPRHPYTAGLLASMPRLSKGKDRLATISGMVPSPSARGRGCAFADRCPRVLPRCREEMPSLSPTESADQCAACWNPVPS